MNQCADVICVEVTRHIDYMDVVKTLTELEFWTNSRLTFRGNQVIDRWGNVGLIRSAYKETETGELVLLS